jgi:hypothetical protein
MHLLLGSELFNAPDPFKVDLKRKRGGTDAAAALGFISAERLLKTEPPSIDLAAASSLPHVASALASRAHPPPLCCRANICNKRVLLPVLHWQPVPALLEYDRVY